MAKVAAKQVDPEREQRRQHVERERRRRHLEASRARRAAGEELPPIRLGASRVDDSPELVAEQEFTMNRRREILGQPDTVGPLDQDFVTPEITQEVADRQHNIDLARQADYLNAPQGQAANLAQGVGSGVANMAGGIVDLPVNLADLAGSAAEGVGLAANRLMGGDESTDPEFYRQHHANTGQDIQDAFGDRARDAGYPVFDTDVHAFNPDDTMSFGDRAVNVTGEFIPQTLAWQRVAMSQIAPAWIGRAYAPPVRNTALAQDVGITGGLGVGTAYAEANDIEGLGGAGIAALGALTGHAGIGLGQGAYNVGRNLSNLRPDFRLPAAEGAKRPSISATNEAASRLQVAATDPIAAADRLTRRATELRAGGNTNAPLPTMGALSRDEGLLVAQNRVKLDNVAEFAAHDAAVAQRARGDLDALSSGAATEPLQEFAAAEAAALRADASGVTRQAQVARDDSIQALQSVESNFVARRVTEGAESATLQNEIVINTLSPLQRQRTGLYNEARTGRAARTETVDPKPFIVAANEIRAARGAFSPSSGLPTEFLNRIAAFEDRMLAAARGSTAAPELTLADVTKLTADLSTATRAAEEAVNVNLQDALGRLKAVVRQTEDDLVAAGSPAGEALRAAREFDTQVFMPYFGNPTRLLGGNRAGATLRSDFNLGRLGTPTEIEGGASLLGSEGFANKYFLNAQRNGADTAADLRSIVEMSATPEVGLEAARNYLMASAARSVGANGQVRAPQLRRWITNNRGSLDVFPEVRSELERVIADIGSASTRVSEAEMTLRLASSQAKLTERQINHGWLGNVLGADPHNVVRGIMGSRNPEQQMREMVARVSREGPEVKAALEESVYQFLRNTLTTSDRASTSTGARPVSWSNLDDLTSQHSGVFDALYGPGTTQRQNLTRMHGLLQDVQFGQKPLAGAGLPPRPDFGTEAMRHLRLPIRFLYGHLRGGAIERTGKLALNATTLDLTPAVNDLLLRASFDPEIAAILLRRTVTPIQERARLTALTQALSAGVISRQVEPSEHSQGPIDPLNTQGQR